MESQFTNKKIEAHGGKQLAHLHKGNQDSAGTRIQESMSQNHR